MVFLGGRWAKGAGVRVLGPLLRCGAVGQCEGKEPLSVILRPSTSVLPVFAPYYAYRVCFLIRASTRYLLKHTFCLY